MPNVPSDRRADLDWIRVGAFALLILYHVGMFYVTWDWHVKSPRASHALEPLMVLTNPWRLTLLFFVSGAATRFIFDKAPSPGGLARQRTARLLPPLLLAMFVIVPPQTWYEISEQAPQLALPFPAFYAKYVTASGGWCAPEGCLITPTWNHMWFVAYLLVYTLLLALALRACPRLGERISALLDRLPAWIFLAAPVAIFALLRLTLQPVFGSTHALVDDWYEHPMNLFALLLGYGYAKSDRARDGAISLRWVALALWLGGWALYAAFVARYAEATPSETMLRLARILFAVQQWSAVVAVLGFGAKHLNRGGPVLRYLTLGVFPFYLVHQTIIVIAGHHLARANLPIGVEGALLVALTAAGCWATYELARRAGPLAGWFGLKPERRLRPAAAAA
ncbi:acyltransferase family protein [Phenylobacterium sp.]|jgi:peptidoglycan/LPS O-acetylase OafA/YrhL|uniref:acyltransferase family protein n=1 Tax=Phenylobacterium sp. TaxID=1871053 RepID=UPI002F937E51